MAGNETYIFPEFRYLNTAASLDLQQDADGFLFVQADDPYRLNDLYTQSGCVNHTQSGCTNHYNNYCSNHYDGNYYCTNYYRYTYTNSKGEYYAGSSCSDYKVCSDYYYYHNQYVDDWATYDNHAFSPYYACRHGCVEGQRYVNGYSYINNYYPIYCYECSDYYYYKHSQTYCYDRYSYGCDHCNNTGYNNHTNSGYNNHTNYTNNFSPVLEGIVTPSAGTFNQSVPLQWPAATDTPAQGQDPQTIVYELKYQYKPQGGDSFGEWQMLIPKEANHTATSYIWNTANLPAGIYRVSIVAWDGLEYSENTLISDELIISHYQAPSWSTIINDQDTVFRKSDMDEVRTEVNKAREAFGLEEVEFTDPNIIPHFTLIKTEHITELRDAVLEARNAAGKGSTFGWARSSLTKNTTEIQGIDLKEIRTNLDEISG